MPDVKMVKIKLNGNEVEAPAGANLLKYCIDAGSYVPHYCWHPGLSVAANCRMCLVKVSTSRKLEPACNVKVAENLEVITEGPEVKAARESVQEFLLINHPLDCPVCDQAGECSLQDYAFTYGKDRSRMDDRRNVRHTKDLGPTIKIWGNRCIACTRCVRFCDEIAGTGELTLVERGDRSVIDVFPGAPLDNPLAGNTEDVCPVGALINKDFLYQARVWFMKKTESVCAGCSRGCNVTVEEMQGRVKRLKPRYNARVNEWWMCDEGRYSYHALNDDRRLTAFLRRRPDGPPETVDPASAPRSLVAAVEAFRMAYGDGAFGVLASGAMTNEELVLLKALADGPLRAAAIGWLGFERGARRTFPKGFTIEPDKTPNRAGAARILGKETVAAGLTPLLDGIAAGRIRGVLAFNGIPHPEAVPPALAKAFAGLEFAAVADILSGPLSDSAHLTIPVAGFAETSGTIVNIDGRIQRLTLAVPPPGQAQEGAAFLQSVLAAFSGGNGAGPLSAEGVFRKWLAGPAGPFEGLTYKAIGRAGVETTTGMT